MKFTDFHNSELAEASKTRNPTRDFLRNNPVSSDQMAKPVKQMSVPELAAKKKKEFKDRLKGVVEDSLNEFDPGEHGIPPFTVYVGDTLIGKFTSYDEAQEEVEYQRGLDPRWTHDQWKIVNGIDDTVWEYDVGEKSDDMRRQHKIQFIPQDEQGIAEGLDEAVGGNYLYHATGPDINDLKNIIMDGLRTNTGNQERTGSKLRALSFTRNWRYALTKKDDDNQATDGIANGVILVVDQSILRQKNKMQSVDRPADKLNALRSILNALPGVNRVTDLYSLADGVGNLTPDDLVVLSKIAGANVTGSRQFVIFATKTYFADKTNQQALADAQSKIKQAISYFLKTSAGKSIASAGGSTGSEYEEVILTPLNNIPFKDLGIVGYMINPIVDSTRQQEIRNLFAKAGVKEMPIPNSTRPGKNITDPAISPMIGTIRYQNRDQQGVAEGSAQTYTVLAWKNSTNDSPDVEELDIEAGQARDMAQELKAEGYKVVKIKKQGVAEGGMPSSVIKSKQRYGDMLDKDFAELHQGKSDDDLVAMAWRHGYGKGSLHYVNKRKRGKQGVAEGKGLAKKVKIVKGPDAGKTGWIREVKHGAFKGAPKTYYIDLDDGGQANNLPATALRLVKEQQGVTEARIETIHGSAYTIDPNKYYVWAWDNAVVLYGEYTDENDAKLNLSKIARRATKRLGPAVKDRFEVASGKMLLRQYGEEQGVAEGRAPSMIQTIRDNISGAEISKDREGNLIFRRGFFYTNNGSAEKFAARIDNELTKLNIPHTIVDKGEVWRPFKGGATTKSQSHWWVKVKLGQPSVAEGMFTKDPAIDPTIGKQINSIINRLHNHAKQTKDEYLLGTIQELFDILRNTGGTYSPPGSPGVRDVAEDEKWIQKAHVKKGGLHKALDIPQDETIPKSRIAKAIHSADPHLRDMAQFAQNVAKEDAGGMGAGSVATSMGGGNGFATGGPGTLTRRKK